MSFSNANAFPLPISSLQYPDIGIAAAPESRRDDPDREEIHVSKQRAAMDQAELEARIFRERAEAAAQIEQQLRQEYDQKLKSARLKIAAAIKNFEAQRTEYFARVEAEVVQLSLAIAAKILRHEAQLDPMLIASLVHMAMEKMREGSSVTVRVSPGRGEDWKRYFANRSTTCNVEVAEDAQIGAGDCVLETELGSAHFGINEQLKEVERGFFDLLALRPETR